MTSDSNSESSSATNSTSKTADTDHHGPPAGFTSLTPFIAVAPAAAAIDLYAELFGTRVTSRLDGPDGTVMHCELDFGHGRLQVGDPMSEFGLTAPDPAGDRAAYSLGVYVHDVDATTARARELGATVREEPSDFVTGDRFASIRDPFGVRWTLMHRAESVSDAQVQQRLDAWVATPT